MKVSAFRVTFDGPIEFAFRSAEKRDEAMFAFFEAMEVFNIQQEIDYKVSLYDGETKRKPKAKVIKFKRPK